jgi:hypothetical protein
MSADPQESERLLRARVATLEAANKQSVIRATLATALYQSGVPLRANVQEQLIEVLGPRVTVHAADGVGPVVSRTGNEPVNGEWIRQTLAGPNYAHFRSDQGAAPPANLPPANPRPANPPPTFPGVQEILPEDSLSARIIRASAERQAAAAAIDPRLDVAQPFGIKSRPSSAIILGQLPTGGR